MSGFGAADALGWTGLAVGLVGLAGYILIVLRQPEVVRMLNGSGLLLTSLALTQARILLAAAAGRRRSRPRLLWRC